MPELVVLNESDLINSLEKDHPVTVINQNFVPSVFEHHQTIYYRFSDAPEPRTSFRRSKHIFYPESGARFLQKSQLYSILLSKIKAGHTVVFVVSKDNLSLLRLCECFIALACKTLGTQPPPYVIGQAQLSVPIWTGGKWEANPKSMKDVFRDIFNKKFTGVYYSDTGLKKLQHFYECLSEVMAKPPKARLASHLADFLYWDQIIGPGSLLDLLTENIHKISTILDKILAELEQYKVVYYPEIRELRGPDSKVSAGLEQMLNKIYEDLPIKSEPVVDDACANPVLSEQQENEYRMVFECKYASAIGELLIPTEEAVNGRLEPFSEKYQKDPLGNIYSFILNVGQGRIIVCPEGKEDFYTSAVKTIDHDSSVQPVSAPASGSETLIVRLKSLSGGASCQKVDVEISGKTGSHTVSGEKIIMFLSIYYYSLSGDGIGYCSIKERKKNTSVKPIIGYCKNGTIDPTSSDIINIADEMECSEFLKRLFRDVLCLTYKPDTAKDADDRSKANNALLRKHWLTTSNRKGAVKYNTGKLDGITVVADAGIVVALMDSLVGKKLSQPQRAAIKKML